ncbi:MAG: universal stress protein [Gemmatimonadales bacterium]|nr:universal stress protein [Gemmatimonadales bacterium]
MRRHWLQVNHIVVGANVANASRHPVAVALGLARRTGARCTIVSVAPAPSAMAGSDRDMLAWAQPGLDRLRAWLGPLAEAVRAQEAELAVAFGAVGVELARYAERHHADLIVLGRRVGPGDAERPRFTTDQVVRRARVPCLCLPDGWERLDPLLVALDGTERGLSVFANARDFARHVRSEVRCVTVESVWSGEPDALAAGLPSSRSSRLIHALAQLPLIELRATGALAAAEVAPPPVHVRRGDVVGEVLAEAAAQDAGVLAIGYRLNGPGGEIAPASIARRLVHGTERAVLTIPL